MNWAVTILIALTAMALVYLVLRRSLNRARTAQSRADLLTAALRQSPAMVGITDAQGRLEYVNPAFEKATGYTAGEAQGQNPRILKSGVTPEEDYRRLWETITAGRVWSSELCNKRKDGQLYWERASIAPVSDRTGRITHFVKVAEDITEQKKAAAARARSEKRFRSIFELAGTGIALVDRQGRWLQVNDHLCQMLGYTREELHGRPFQDFTPEEDHHREASWQKTLESGSVRSAMIEKRYLTRDGREVWAEVTATLVRDPLGTPEYYICLIHDVTRRRDAEEEAGRQQNQLAHMARIHTLQQMASELSHEIDQPLCAILSASQALQRMLEKGEALPPDEARQALDIVAGQAERAGAVVDSIRQFSRKGNPEKTAVSVGEVVTAALDLLGPDLRSQQVQVRLTTAGRDQVHVLGDPVLLTQVLVNLIRNGADAMVAAGSRSKELTLGWEQAGPDVVIKVFNTGEPLAPELADRIFVPFFTTRPDGLGLGLSLSRSIVESYGGRLWAEPGEEEGTTFLVRLPGVAEPPAEQQAREMK